MLHWHEVGDDPNTATVIDAFADDRLLTVDERGVEIVHETLHPHLAAPARMDRREPRRPAHARQRITQAASEWQARTATPTCSTAVHRSRRRSSGATAPTRAPEPPAAFLDASRDGTRGRGTSCGRRKERRRRRVRRFAFACAVVPRPRGGDRDGRGIVRIAESQDNEREARGTVSARARDPGRVARDDATEAGAAPRGRERGRGGDPVTADARRAIGRRARHALAKSGDITPSRSPIPVGDVLRPPRSPRTAPAVVDGIARREHRLVERQTGQRRRGLSPARAQASRRLAVDPAGRWLVAGGSSGVSALGPAAQRDRRGQVVSTTPTPSGRWRSRPTARCARPRPRTGKCRSTTPKPPDRSARRSPIPSTSSASRSRSTARRCSPGTGDGRVFIWDIAIAQQSGDPIKAHGTNDVWELVMHPDGDRFATGSSDGTARVWSLDAAPSRDAVCGPGQAPTVGMGARRRGASPAG